MASSAPLTPPASGTATPTTTTLTQAGALNQHKEQKPLANLDASPTKVTRSKDLRPVPTPDDPASKDTKTCTDHMVTAVWRNTTGWEAPEIKPYGPLTLMPTASVLHYATECFEGLKLYRGYDGSLRVFRIRKNCERMRRSALRIALPDFEPAELEKLIIKLCEVDGARWLPKDRPGSFLYIRPTMIGTDATLGVQMPREAMLFIIISCFPIPAAANQGLKLLASKEDSVRAWPGK